MAMEITSILYLLVSLGGGGQSLGLWHWITFKRSKRSPFIRIPKEVLEEIEEMRGLYVIVTDDKEKFEELLEAAR
jgi:hypothetical protein